MKDKIDVFIVERTMGGRIKNFSAETEDGHVLKDLSTLTRKMAIALMSDELREINKTVDGKYNFRFRLQ